MKKILLISVVGLLLLSGLIIIVPSLLDLNSYKETISRKVTEYTGHTLSIQGDMRLYFLPKLTLKAENISLSSGKDSSSPAIARIPKLSLSVKLFPLLSGKVIIDDLTLQNPVFFLEKDAKGVLNWQLRAPKPALVEKEASPTAEKSSFLRYFQLKRIIVHNATIQYQEGMGHMIFDNVEASATLDQISGQADIKLAFNQEKRAVDSTIGIANAFALAEGKDTTVTAEINIDGHHFLLDTDASFKDKKLVLSHAKARLDKISASGDFGIDFSGQVPVIQAVLDMAPMDLTPYLAISAPGDTGGKALPIPPKFHDKWSAAPIKITLPKKLEAHITLRVTALKLGGLVIDRGTIIATVSEGNLHLNGKDLVLYEGNGQATLLVTMAGANMLWNADITLQHINAGRFLTEIGSFKQLSGIADSKLLLSSQGASQKEIIEYLKGQGSVFLRNGALHGVNLAMPPQKLETPLLTAEHKEDETAFDSVSANFTILKGILTNNDLLMHTPFADINGKGTIDFPNKLIHYRLSSAQASKFFGEKPVMVTIEGPINDPKLQLDVSQIIPHNVKEGEQLLKKFKDFKKNKKINKELNKLQELLH